MEFQYIFCSLCIHTDIWEKLSKAGSLSEMRSINNDLKQLAQVQPYLIDWGYSTYVACPGQQNAYMNLLKILYL